jgi:RNA polymerase sigma-70 factor (ECF subfamily)
MEELKKIIEQCKRNDRKGQYALYRHCYGFLLPVCLRYKLNKHDSESILNHGFLKILNALPSLSNIEYFEFWAKRIIINCITDEYRSRNKRVRTIDDTLVKSIENRTAHSVDNGAIDAMTVQEIMELLGKLPEPHRTIFNLFAMDQLKHREIATQLNISEGTSKWYVHKAREILKNQINVLYNPISVKNES